jgi:hypothetical protein
MEEVLQKVPESDTDRAPQRFWGIEPKALSDSFSEAILARILERLTKSHRSVPIQQLANEIGYTRRHFRSFDDLASTDLHALSEFRQLEFATLLAPHGHYRIDLGYSAGSASSRNRESVADD